MLARSGRAARSSRRESSPPDTGGRSGRLSPRRDRSGPSGGPPLRKSPTTMPARWAAGLNVASSALAAPRARGNRPATGRPSPRSGWNASLDPRSRGAVRRVHSPDKTRTAAELQALSCYDASGDGVLNGSLPRPIRDRAAWGRGGAAAGVFSPRARRDFRRVGFPGDSFWVPAERLTYFVLFPTLDRVDARDGRPERQVAWRSDGGGDHRGDGVGHRRPVRALAAHGSRRAAVHEPLPGGDPHEHLRRALGGCGPWRRRRFGARRSRDRDHRPAGEPDLRHDASALRRRRGRTGSTERLSEPDHQPADHRQRDRDRA